MGKNWSGFAFAKRLWLLTAWLCRLICLTGENICFCAVQLLCCDLREAIVRKKKWTFLVKSLHKIWRHPFPLLWSPYFRPFLERKKYYFEIEIEVWNQPDPPSPLWNYFTKNFLFTNDGFPWSIFELMFNPDWVRHIRISLFQLHPPLQCLPWPGVQLWIGLDAHIGS